MLELILWVLGGAWQAVSSISYSGVLSATLLAVEAPLWPYMGMCFVGGMLIAIALWSIGDIVRTLRVIW